MQLAKHHPSKIYLAARSKEKADESLARIKTVVPDATVDFLPLDLTSLKSVAKAAQTVNATTNRLDILINNAGIMATPAGTTEDGYEIQFGTNHMGHALLTKLLLPKLQETAKNPESDVRIVTLSSRGHEWTPNGGLNLETVKSEQTSISSFARYGQSKLANILYSRELARRYPGIKCISLHPGSVNTGLRRGMAASHPWLTRPMDFLAKFVTVTVQDGTLNQLWAATSVDAKSGSYYNPVGKESKGSGHAQDDKLAGKLWEWTEKELEKWPVGAA